MLTRELINAAIPVLSLSDTAFHAQQLMADFHVMHLPVVQDDKYIGLISEDDVLNTQDDTATLLQFEQRLSKLYVRGNAYFTEAVHLSITYGLSIVPVVDKEMEWIGALALPDLLKYLGQTTGAETPGGIIVLELNKTDFAFSEICKIVETNDAQITQLNTFFDSQDQIMNVVIKINKFEISDIVATFQRYEYSIKHYFGEELYENELRNNYNHLMNYLNM